MPDVSVSFQRLEKDGSITDMGTKTMSAVTLLQTMKVNDEPSDRGTVRALQVLDLVDKKTRVEAAAVLGTVNGHEFGQHLVAALTADPRTCIKRRAFRQCVNTALSNCGPKGCFTNSFNRQAYNVKNQSEVAKARLRKVRSKFGAFRMKGQNRLQVATAFLELGVLLGKNSMALLERHLVQNADTRLPGWVREPGALMGPGAVRGGNGFNKRWLRQNQSCSFSDHIEAFRNCGHEFEPLKKALRSARDRYKACGCKVLEEACDSLLESRDLEWQFLLCESQKIIQYILHGRSTYLRK